MRTLVTLIIIFICCSLNAQVPQGFNYQGVIRDGAGLVQPSQNISLQITLLEGGQNGTEVYQETIDTQTSILGLFNVQIGTGQVITGDFTTIDWAPGDYFVEVGLDQNGGDDFVILGTNKLYSVPFAMYAGNGTPWTKQNEDLAYDAGSIILGDGTVNTSALLELNSNNSGLLLPRIALVATTDNTPLAAHVEGMFVYNTATSNDVTPGLYFNDGTKWNGMKETIETIETLKDSIQLLQNQIPLKKAIIIAGQSNTHFGAGAASIPDLTGKNISQLGRVDVNLQKVPITFYGSYHHSRFVSTGSFGTIFMNHYYNDLQAKQPGRILDLLLIPCGAAGSGWNEGNYPGNSWRTDAGYFADIVQRIKWAKNNGYEIEAILWHQGESDAIGQTINYKDLMHNFIQGLRDHVGNPALPFILGEMVPSWVEANAAIAEPVQQLINDIPNEVPYTATSTGEDLPISDAIHFSAQAHVEMGKRYFDKFELAKENSNPPNYQPSNQGEHLIYNFEATSGAVFPDIFSAIRFGESETDDLYSALGDIWKHKNDDSYHFKLEVIDGNGEVSGIFEWTQKFSPFALSEAFYEDRASFEILNNTIGLNTDPAAQGFASLVYDDSPAAGTYFTLFHADTRANAGFWWFAIGQAVNFSNTIPIVETIPDITHVRLYSLKD